MQRCAHVLGLSSLMALLAAAVFAAPSRAATIKASCVVSGLAKVQDKEFAKMGARLIGGSGAYTVNEAPFTCVGTEKGNPRRRWVRCPLGRQIRQRRVWDGQDSPQVGQ